MRSCEGKEKAKKNLGKTQLLEKKATQKKNKVVKSFYETEIKAKHCLLNLLTEMFRINRERYSYLSHGNKNQQLFVAFVLPLEFTNNIHFFDLHVPLRPSPRGPSIPRHWKILLLHFPFPISPVFVLGVFLFLFFFAHFFSFFSGFENELPRLDDECIKNVIDSRKFFSPCLIYHLYRVYQWFWHAKLDLTVRFYVRAKFYLLFHLPPKILFN